MTTLTAKRSTVVAIGFRVDRGLEPNPFTEVSQIDSSDRLSGRSRIGTKLHLLLQERKLRSDRLSGRSRIGTDRGGTTTRANLFVAIGFRVDRGLESAIRVSATLTGTVAIGFRVDRGLELHHHSSD